MNRKLIPAILIFALIVVAAVIIFEDAPIAPQILENGTAKSVSFGKAGEYGYATFSYNGSGEVQLFALSEKPKNNIIVLKQDYLSTGNYPFFLEFIKTLEEKGFTVSEVEQIYSPYNSIIIIPSGAMPMDILSRVDNLSESNHLIYIGKLDLLYSQNLLHEQWYSNLSSSSKEHITVIEKTLDEFYDESNSSLLTEIESNSWALTNAEIFPFSGKGTKTVFINLKNASWLRMLPLADSLELISGRAEMFGPEDVFEWQNIPITLQLNYSYGTAYYTVEKDGNRITEGELQRVRSEEAFFIKLGPYEPGDYLLSVFDSNGMLGAKRIHVKNLSISLLNAYGDNFEFSALIDGKPISDERVLAGLSHSNKTVPLDIKNGKFSVRATLKEGTNIFIIQIFGQKKEIEYMNGQEDLLQFYLKYLGIGAVIVAVSYMGFRLMKKSNYKIIVPEGTQVSNPEIRLKTAQVIYAINAVEKRFGWKNTPLYAKEIAIGLMQFTGGREINEGNIEAIMKKMQEKDIVLSHSGLYGLPEWGDAQKNALRRMARDKLIEHGIKFKEDASGFSFGKRKLRFDAHRATPGTIVVFEDNGARQSYLSSLKEAERAALELKLKNAAIIFTTMHNLVELL